MKSIHRLQLAQNAAARGVKRTPKREHMTPVQRDLHWLPIIKRVQLRSCYSCSNPSIVKHLLMYVTY